MIFVKYIILISLFSVLLKSCRKEENTNYKAMLINKSSVQILLVSYIDGRDVDRITINDGSSVIIGEGTDRGFVNHAGFDSKYLSGVDSVIIIFNDSFSVSHYNNNPIAFSFKYYLQENSRNIFNYLNYNYYHQDKSRGWRNAYYRFTFTEEDYNFAKD